MRTKNQKNRTQSKWKPIQLTHEQAVEYGRKGGLASGKARQRNRLIKDTYNLVAKLTKEQILEIAELIKNYWSHIEADKKSHDKKWNKKAYFTKHLFKKTPKK